MLYLTKNNFSRLLKAMELDVPREFLKKFYWESELKHFNVNLSYFTEPQAHLLVLSNMLYNDISTVMERIQLAKLKETQAKWVYPIANAAFHKKADCQFLHNDFTNVLMPESLNPSRAEEYRAFFIQECEKYGYSANKCEPMSFCRILKKKFGLTEEPEQIEQKHFRKSSFENSEVQEFNLTLDFDLEISRIQKQITEFNELTKDVTPEDARRAFLAKKEYSPFSKEKKEKMLAVEETRKALLSRMMNFYFQHLQKHGFDISEKLLLAIGFKPCTCCK